MQIEDDVYNKLIVLCGLFQKAELAVKEAENVNRALAIPAINELRYTGYHLTRFINAKFAKEKEDALDTAIKQCKRAYFDGKEAIILYYLDEINKFKAIFEKNPFTIEIIKEYPKIIADVEETFEHFKTIRDNHYESKEEFYETCEPHCEKLKKVILLFESSSPLIINKEFESQKAARIATRRFIITTLLSFLAVLMLVLTFYYNCMKKGQEILPSRGHQQEQKQEFNIQKSTPKIGTSTSKLGQE